MSFFKKLTKGSSDKKDEQKEAKRKQTLVSELQKSSGLSVAFMTELKQKTEAIRLLKLENDEWSDDEDVTPNVGVDSASNYPLSSPVVPKDSKGKLDLKAVAARMGLKKRPKKEDVRSHSPHPHCLKPRFPVILRPFNCRFNSYEAKPTDLQKAHLVFRSPFLVRWAPQVALMFLRLFFPAEHPIFHQII